VSKKLLSSELHPEKTALNGDLRDPSTETGELRWEKEFFQLKSKGCDRIKVQGAKKRVSQGLGGRIGKVDSSGPG